jgi:uncharacterized damage-inducible protein DinB
MTAKDALKQNIEFCGMITDQYVADLSDADLMIRPVGGMNHIAWQLGHLAASTQQLVTMLGHNMPDLPADFAEAHTKETSTSDDAAKFAKKSEYVDLLQKMRAAAMTALEKTPEAELDKPGPEPVRQIAATVGAVFALVGSHELMHAGQFIAVRRQLNKPPLF